MGRRRRRVVRIVKKKLPTVFTCPRCGEEAVRVTIDKQTGHATVLCALCQLKDEFPAHPAAQMIDVYERGDDGLFDFRGLMVKGEAHQVAKSEERRKAVKLLQDRHPGAPFGDNPIVVRIIPRKRYRWGPWNKTA